MAEAKPQKLKIEYLVDAMFLIGLIMLGIGLAFAISWPVSMSVIGVILVVLSLWFSAPRNPKGVD